MNKLNANEVNSIDMSKLLQLSVTDSVSFGKCFQSAVLFLADQEGQIITIREIGGLNTQMIEVLYQLKDSMLEKEYPFDLNGCLTDIISVSLPENTWDGYLGMIASISELENNISIKSFLEGFRNALYLSYYLQNYRFEKTEKDMEEASTALQKILKDSNYDINMTSIAKSVIELIQTSFDPFVKDVLLFERLDDALLSLVCSTTDRIETSSKQCYLHRNSIQKEWAIYTHTEMTKNMWMSCDFHYDKALIVPTCTEKTNPLTVLVILLRDQQVEENNYKEFKRFLKEVKPILLQAHKNDRGSIELKRKALLLQVTKKFHSSMDVGEVLGEMIYAVEEMYPSFSVNLLLSRDWKVSENLPVKQFNYGIESYGVGETAFLTGDIQIEDVIKDQCSRLYAPLRGKQGVYGVMQIQTTNSMVFPKHEIEFIETLADIGGNALENAELYQQSQQLINDLQLINQTSHQLNSNLRLSDTIRFMTDQILRSFSAEQVGYIMFTSGELNVLEGSTEFYFTEKAQVPLATLSKQIKIEKESLFVGDAKADGIFEIDPYQSLLAVPMVQSGELKGMVVVLHQNPYHFTFENFKLLQSLIHHSTLAFTNSILHEELERLVITDHLTRLYSRNYLDQKIQESMFTDAYGCFILIDIDNFKLINDTYGHQVGDDIIIQVANVMKKNIRDHDIAARWGGEELAIYLPKVQLETGIKIAERIVKNVAIETSPRVTISCGISYWDQTDEKKSLKLLFNMADECLYIAKKSGKNQVIDQTNL
ncbi:sensor domain-containing diguanylate cyclase [Alkalihalobacterium chitinilyticum]|uniref:Diguanylate cyclase n=1 Tax=Alkalihalobacterium chitinilyticum TaxID=2980103 RepID=A0ABT5VKQ9_9BACI|nr:diguanylate cyclase [Alkalihalobacterium chitinilyticum]MDE5415892.1 diguanylate cyclase [Alkalihalobacterium chitinilyticum]